jgi:hypothetical protein
LEVNYSMNKTLCSRSQEGLQPRLYNITTVFRNGQGCHRIKEIKGSGLRLCEAPKTLWVLRALAGSISCSAREQHEKNLYGKLLQTS